MNSQILRISAVTLALLAASPVLAQEATEDEAATALAGAEDDDGTDWGWIGLLGLLGLAGLRGRRNDTVVTTNRH